MADNPSIEYEKLVRDLYQTLQDAEHPGTIKVEHDKKVEGSSGCRHQIDVYWEVCREGEISKVAIECKHYNKTVEIRVVRDFFGVVHDTGVKGIVVTKHGFQKGARQFADQYGISLVEVRSPEGADWDGRVRSVHVEATAIVPCNFRLEIIPDEEWVAHKGLEPDELEVLCSHAGESQVLDEADRVIIAELRTLMQKLSLEEIKSGETIRAFPGHFLVHPKHGRLKILGVKLLNDSTSNTESFTSDGAEIVTAILKDVSTGEIKMFGNDGDVR